MSLSTTSEDEFADILKQTDAILTEARLNKIAKESKSIGAMLDQRTLYPIEDVVVRTKKSIQQEIDKRIHSRRGGRGERDIKPQAALVLESFREKGVHIDLLTGNYELELNMWKNNARRSIHSEQRKYKHPELHHFLVTMDSKQKSLFKERMGAHLIRIAEDLREECRAMKQEMDYNGIFHPEANSHRVHCIYMMKLHKKITPENIEDHILHRMYNEHLIKQRSEEELAQKKEALLQTIAAEEEKKKKRRGRPLYEAPNAQSQQSQAQSIQPSLPTAAGKDRTGSRSPARSPERKSTPGTTKRSSSADNLKRANEKKAGNDQASGLQSNVTVKITSTGLGGDDRKVEKLSIAVPKSKSLPSLTRQQSMGRGLKGHEATGTTTVGSMDESTETTGHGGMSPERRNQQKIFNKNTRPDRLGFMDSSSLLKEEAARFANTETVLLRKPRDKNNILEDKITQWMLHGIQQQQIDKAATRSTTIIPNDQNVWAASAEKVVAMSNYSPTKVLPFDDYYKVLRDQAGDIDNMIVPSSSIVSPARSTGSAPATTKTTSFHDDHRWGSPPHGSGASSVATAQVNNQAEAPRPPATLNLVKHFAENDKNFDAYLKVSELEQPSAKLFAKLSNGKAVKPKKIRRMAPLGKNAVHLMDSRGKASRLATKGFVNVFKLPKKSRGQSPGLQDATNDEYTSSSSSSDDDDDSAIRRLGSVSVEDDQASVNSSNASLGDRNVSSPGDRPNGLTSDASRRSLLSNSRSRRRGLIQSDSVLGSPGGSPSPSLASRGKRNSNFFEDNLDEMLYPSLPESDLDLQNKLQVTWDALQMPAMDRLAFMTKYSTQAYASEMGRAIDLWADAAVLLVLFQESLALRQRIVANALAVISAKPRDLLADVFRKIPPLLASRSPLLAPLSSAFERANSQAESLSASTLAQMRTMLKDFIVNITLGSASSGIDELPASRAADVPLLHRKAALFCREVGMMAQLRVEAVERTLGDIVPFNGRAAKDWMLTQDVMKVIDTDLN